jgi:predicted MFS family arabinose efflux permease
VAQSVLTRFVAARTVGILGDRVADIALPLAILAATGSTTRAAAVGVAAQAPQVFGALHIGAMVDRYARRSILIWSDIVRATAYTAVGLVLVTSTGGMYLLIPLALVIGAADSAFNASAASFLPAITPRPQLLKANGLIESADAGATLLGPPVSGWLIQTFSTLTAFLFNAFTFLVSAMFIRGLPKDRPSTPLEPARDEQRSQLLSGVRGIFSSRQQVDLLTSSVYVNVLAGSFILATLSRLRNDLHLDAIEVGLILSSAGIGGLIVSLLLSRRVGHVNWRIVLGIAILVNSSTFVVLSYAANFWLLATTILLLDGASALSFILVATTRQQITDDTTLGRSVAAASAVTALARLIGLLAVGVLLDVLGTTPVLLGLGVLGIPFVANLFLAVAKNRQSTRITASEAP